ncbi:MAG: hypothetical protein NT155_03170 [Candidatus Staskawiczbacteria bacterium]|nr:hypothetical protein [Candidatus Staskawiczbacteria bacterium]
MIERFRQARAMREMWGSITINTRHDRSFEELVAAGNYAHVDKDISPEHFPFPKSDNDAEEQIVFFRFDHRRFSQIFKRVVTFKEIIGRIHRDKARGYLPIGIEELLTIGEKFTNLSPLVALAAVWKYSIPNVIVTSSGKRINALIMVDAFPCIFEADGGRYLGLRRFFAPPEAQKWETDWRFGAIDNLGR